MKYFKKKLTIDNVKIEYVAKKFDTPTYCYSYAQLKKNINNFKKNFKSFSLIRLENSSLLGTPDLLVCNTSGHFCTIELKVTKGNKIRFSPHQIAFHTRHNKNTFIMVKALGPLPPKTSPISMYRGSRIRELAACGLMLDACYSGWDACRLALEA